MAESHKKLKDEEKMAESQKKLTDEEIQLKRTEENKKKWEEVKKIAVAEADTQNATGPKLPPTRLTDEEIRLLRTEESRKRLEELEKAIVAQARTYNVNAMSPKPFEKKLTYEENRLKRREQNIQRWEAMKKALLTQAKAENAPNVTGPELSPVKVSQEVDLSAVKRPDQVVDKPPPNNKEMKKVKPKVRQEVDLSAVRRSNRVADKPPPNYREVVIEPLGRPRSYKRRDLLNRIYAADEDRQYAIERAEQLQSELDAEFPSFVKPMLQSHVTGGFWLGLPVHFCKTHLPKHDEYITLVDENEDECNTKYLALKTGLSGGWRGFAIDHELVDGDALVFQLVAPTRFKVYIVRVNQAED